MVSKGRGKFKPKMKMSGWIVRVSKGRRSFRLHARTKGKAMKIYKYFKMKGWR